MNKTYRLIWDELTQCRVAVAEIARSRGKHASGTTLLAAAGILLAVTPASTFAAPPNPPAATQLPTGGQVVAGQASIGQNAAVMNINQSSVRAAIDWQSFNIGSQAQVNFIQPSSSSVTLNRVLDSNPSQIFGRMTANGQVFLTNPNGVYFAPGASVDVGGLVATTHGIGNADFMAGKNTFTRNGATGSVINEGSLNASLGGYIALLAPEVRNQGVIVAQMGTVALAAGEAYELQFEGNNTLAGLRVEPSTIQALVENGNAVQAPGGLIILSAQAASALQGSVVKNSGVIEAQGITSNGGVIRLDAGGGQTTVSGALDASSATGKGGRLEVTGDAVRIEDGAHLNASGKTGGGDVLVGGSWQNTEPSVRQAATTYVASTALLEASATDSGNGGTVVAWSDIHNPLSATRAWGTFLARGGINGGNGGRIETSGHWLDTQGVKGDASARQGLAGMWLFDPYSVTITSANANGSFSSGTWTPSGNNSTILNTDINTLLEGGTSVTITTGSAGTQIGDIAVNSAITKGTGNTDVTLTLQAANSIVVNQAISNTGGSGKLNVVLDADNNNGTGDGAGIVMLYADITTNGGNLSFGTGRTASVGGASTLVGGDVFVAGTGARTISTNGGNLDVRGEMIVSNTSGLNINTANGNVTFGGLLNSGDQYTYVDGPDGQHSWNWARTDAKGATAGGSAVNDSYLVNITSRLENSVAVSAAGYNGAWIGAYRPNLASRNWVWADGPETGVHFFTQNTSGGGGSATAGYYSNFGSGEPNGATNSSGESVGQFFGTGGQWNDLVASTTFSGTQISQYSVLGYVRETNLAASPVAVNAGTGTVTFTGAVGGNKALASLNVTAATVAVNGGAVTTEGLQTYTGNVTLGSSATTLTQTNANTDFTLQASKTITNATSANASLTIKTTGSILMNAGSAISSSAGGLSTVLHADSDATGGGAIKLNAGSSLGSNGGAITLSGGTDVTTGYAQGDSTNVHGVFLDGATLQSGGGNIILRGKSHNDGGGDRDGVRIGSSGATAATVSSGTGTIYIEGKTYSGSSSNNAGVRINEAVASTVTSANTTSSAITIVGDASGMTGTATNSDGFILEDNHSITATGSGGGISITGTGKASQGYGVRFTTGGNILANGGPITITGIGGATAIKGYASSGNGATLGYKSGSSVTSSSSDITLVGDSLTLYSGDRIQSSGALTIRPYTASTTIGVAGGSGTLSLLASYFSTNFVDGFSGITVGSASAGAITVGGATTLNDATTFVSGGNIAVNAALNGSGQTLTLTGGNGATVSGSGNITASSLLLNGSGATYTLNTAAGNSVSTLAASTGSGNIAFYNNGALTIGSVGGTNGITTSGTVDVETLTGNLTVSQDITSTNTGSSAIVLNAGRSTAAGTATGGNLILSGSPALTVGTGGRATLYSGSLSGSSGLATLIGSSSGRFRYNSDEAAANYTTALGSGSYAIYREQPTLTVTADNQSMTYGASVPTLTTTLAGLQNGDSLAQAVSTAASVAVGGSTSGAGNYTAGSHALTPSAAAGGLGYGFSYVNGVLTVNQKTLTISGSSVANKTYDGTTTATISNAGSLTGVVTSDTVSASNSGATFDTRNVGTGKTVTLSGIALTGTDAGNYSIASTATATADITKAALTVTANHASRTYDGLAYSGGNGVGYAGFVNSETAAVLGGTLAYGGSSQGAVNAGSYAITPSGYSAGNYTLSYVDGTLTVIMVPQPAPPPPALPPVTNAQPPLALQSAGSGDQGATGRSGISISLVRMPTLQTMGMIAVMVPKETATAGSGFSFALPEEVARLASGSDATVQVMTENGGLLPAWLRYLPETRAFAVSAVPDGAFPMQVLVRVGAHRAMVVISERTGQ